MQVCGADGGVNPSGAQISVRLGTGTLVVHSFYYIIKSSRTKGLILGGQKIRLVRWFELQFGLHTEKSQ